MSREFLTKDGRSVYLRQVVEDDAQVFITAVDSVAREQVYFLRSRFDIDVEKEKAFIAQAAGDGNLLLAAILDGELVGWVTLLRAKQEFLRHTGDLGMGVLRGYRGIGVGSALMAYALEWAAEHGFEKVNLGVRAGNLRAQALYHKFGFVQEGRRVRQIKDLDGCYDDDIDMAYHVPRAEKEP